MIQYNSTAIAGVYVVSSQPVGDTRGGFARFFCADTHRQQVGKPFVPLHINHSHTAARGTVRGLHFQKSPALESKIVRCVRGRIFDVAVDIRRGSPTFLKHVAVELDASRYEALVLPEGVAHGFQTLEDNCELLYLHSAFYTPEYEGGLCYDDPRLAIDWPLSAQHLSARDQSFALLSADYQGIDV